jgi:hypothetical protein
LYWPCVPGRRPRPNGIDAPQSARDEGLRQTEFDSRGHLFDGGRSLRGSAGRSTGFFRRSPRLKEHDATRRGPLCRTSRRGPFFLHLGLSRHVLRARVWLGLLGGDPVGSRLFRCGQRPARRSASAAQRIDESRQAFHAKTVSHARSASWPQPGRRRGAETSLPAARSRLPIARHKPNNPRSLAAKTAHRGAARFLARDYFNAVACGRRS